MNIMFRRSSPSIYQSIANHQRFRGAARFSGSATASSPLRSTGGSGFGAGGEEEDLFDSFLRSVSSGVAIAGLSLGFAYWFSGSSSSSPNVNSFLSLADYPRDSAMALAPNQVDQLLEEKPSWFLFADSFRKRVFFNYEKRLRIQSPPEKVFEYFASLKTPDGDVFMRPADLMRAIVPVFPPDGSDRVREGFLRGERVPGELHCAPSNFFMLFDTNNDGLISFPEYIFFVTLLSIPESSFSVAFKMFDLDSNGEIDKEEFKKVMALMRAQNRQGVKHRDGRRHGFKVVSSVENAGLIEYFFGNDGKASLKHERFVQFLRDLHEEILKLEFAHYDHGSRGTISAKDFALSLVASAEVKHINKFLDRVDQIDNEPQIRDKRLTFKEFKAFAELRKKLLSFSLAIFSYGKMSGLLTKTDFQRAASQVCGVTITDSVVDIIYHVFDVNGDGNLSSEEFIRVLEHRERDNGQTRQAGLKGLFSCMVDCTSKCPSAKLLL